MIEQDEAHVEVAPRANLDYCTIRSPVKGTVIDRRVNVGQTVVSQMSTSSMFLIAKDLRRLQIWASVNEADVGQIHVGQQVDFTVDAFSGEKFRGVVSQVRLNATMTQNVVTYTVVVNTDNSNGKLLPYLTTNLKFEVERHDNVLQVPSMALKWHPAGWKGGHHGGAAANKPRGHGQRGRQGPGYRQPRRGRRQGPGRRFARPPRPSGRSPAGKNQGTGGSRPHLGPRFARGPAAADPGPGGHQRRTEHRSHLVGFQGRDGSRHRRSPAQRSGLRRDHQPLHAQALPRPSAESRPGAGRTRERSGRTREPKQESK